MPSQYTNKSLLLYLGSEVERIGGALESDREVIIDAIRLSGDVLRSNYRYSSLDAVASATFYIATRRYDTPNSLSDIAEYSRKPESEFKRLAGRLMDELDIQLTPEEPDPYLQDGINELGFDQAAADEAWALLRKSKYAGLHNGLAPTTMAGAILYAIVQKYHLDITQTAVADTVNRTESSIRNHYRDVLQLADDVPVDVLPPQTVDAAIDILIETFNEVPDEYAIRAQELVNNTDEIEHNTSRAGMVGGAYFAVCQQAGIQMTETMIADTVGVRPATVANHAERFEQ